MKNRCQVSGVRDQGSGNRVQGTPCPILATSRGPRRQVFVAGVVGRKGGKAQMLAVLFGFSTLLIAGCRQDMQDQPKMFPQRGSNIFADHRGARPQVVNTVARGQLREDSFYYTGVIQGANGYREERNALPFPVTVEVLKRGQERFNIYCTPCHSRVGNGLASRSRSLTISMS